MYDVITIGSATLDIFVKSNQFKVIDDTGFDSGVALCEAYGAKIEVDEIVLTTGGGATNTAVSFARKGLNVASVVEMGNDLGAKSVIGDLEKEGVNISFLVQEENEKTATSVIMVAPEGGRSIIVYRGAAAMLEVRDIDWKELKKTKWLYITSLGGKMKLLSELVDFAVKNRIKVALNPGSKELAEVDKLKEIVSKVDVLNMNLEEAKRYLGVGHPGNDPQDFPGVDGEELKIGSQDREVLQRMKKEGGRLNIVTNGKQGAYIFSEGGFWFCFPSDDDSIESTGAGDAFGSGFVAGRILGWDVEKSCQLAVANAGSVIRYFGAKKGLISLKDFEKMQKVEIELMKDL